jgi:hypothetical protein
MKPVFNFYADAGHGWLRVPKHLLVELGIADKITAYSLQLTAFSEVIMPIWRRMWTCLYF